MNSKQRVSIALKRQGLPDRVPMQFDLSRSLLKKFAEKYGVPAYFTTSYYEDVTYRISGNDLRVAMGSDCVVVGASLPRGYTHPVDDSGCIINEFGMRMREGPIYIEVVEHPLAGVKGAEQVNDFVFPDPLAEGRYDDAARFIEKYRQSHFIVGDMELTMFDMMAQLVGLEKLLLDMAMGEPYVEALIDKTMNFALAVGKRLVSMGVDGIWAGDDFGSQNGLLISPPMWRRYFKERYRHVYAQLKMVNPNVMIMQHSDGAVASILDEWIEVGLEVFNPVQPNVPGHSPEELKDKFGDKVSFWGAIDQQSLLPFGTPLEIEADVKAKITVLGRGGGYMAAPAHIIQAGTPMENVEAFINAVRKNGT
ncbi:MAG: uroporphyrinogen decarboxylase family protein [Terriglobia bacterium]